MSTSSNTEMPCILSLHRFVGKKQRFTRSLSLRLIALRIGPKMTVQTEYAL